MGEVPGSAIITFPISHKAWRAGIDAHHFGGSQAAVEAERAIRELEWRKIGHGWSGQCTVSMRGAEMIRDACSKLGGEQARRRSDPDVIANGRALQKVATRVTEEIQRFRIRTATSAYMMDTRAGRVVR